MIPSKKKLGLSEVDPKWRKYIKIYRSRKAGNHSTGGSFRTGCGQNLQQLGIHKSALYKWYKAYLDKGTEGLQPERKTRRQWNTIPKVQKQLVVEIALDHPQLSPRELAVKLTDEQGIFISQVQCVPYSEGQGFDYYAGSYSAFCF